MERLWVCLSACTAHAAGRSFSHKHDDTGGERCGAPHPCGSSARREFDASCGPPNFKRSRTAVPHCGCRDESFGRAIRPHRFGDDQEDALPSIRLRLEFDVVRIEDNASLFGLAPGSIVRPVLSSAAGPG